MASDSTNTQHLLTQRDEFIKQYIVYDAAGRPEFVYTAPTDAKDQTPCSAVIYEYINATSSKVLKMKEVQATWLAAYDTAITLS